VDNGRAKVDDAVAVVLCCMKFSDERCVDGVKDWIRARQCVSAAVVCVTGVDADAADAADAAGRVV